MLVVDDEPNVRETVGALLGAHGFLVSEADGGEPALAVAAEEPLDLVLLDLAMPGLDGFVTCQRLRLLTHVPIVVLSARSDEADKVRALDAGADDYVTKPFGSAELLARLRAALRRSRMLEDATSVVKVGDLTINMIDRTVHRGKTELRLTPTEFSLLRELALNADRVLTQRHLLAAVFGPGYENATANLRLFIAQLRRKVEPDPTRPRLIVTEPGVGYRFRSN